MIDRFPKWSAQLKKDGVGPFAMPSIVRTLPYGVTLTLEGDFSLSTFTMQARAAPDSPQVLATFTCDPGDFANDETRIRITLGSGAQGGLPADTDGDGVEILVYDIICSPPVGNDFRILGGLIPISGIVTQ